MYLLYGVVLLCSSLLLCGVTLLGARNPIRPAWANEELIANLYTPLMIGLFILGIMNIIQFLIQGTLPSAKESLYSAMVVGLMVVIYLKSHIRERVAAFSATTATGQVIAVDFQNKVTDDPAGYRKAA